MDLTNEDVADVLALLDSLPYDEFDLQTRRFRLTLRRTPDGWTQSSQSLAQPRPLEPAPASTFGPRGTQGSSIGPGGPHGPVDDAGDGEPRARESTSGAGVAEGAKKCVAEGLAAVRAPLPGTFYRAPRPGAAPFVEVGSRVSADTVVGIVETMKLMNSVPAGTEGTVAEICVGNAEPTAQGATLMRIRADR